MKIIPWAKIVCHKPTQKFFILHGWRVEEGEHKEELTEKDLEGPFDYYPLAEAAARDLVSEKTDQVRTYLENEQDMRHELYERCLS